MRDVSGRAEREGITYRRESDDGPAAIGEGIRCLPLENERLRKAILDRSDHRAPWRDPTDPRVCFAFGEAFDHPAFGPGTGSGRR